MSSLKCCSFCKVLSYWMTLFSFWHFSAGYCMILNASSLMSQSGFVKIKDHDACLALWFQPCKFNITVSQMGRSYVGLTKELFWEGCIRKCCGLNRFHIFCRKCCEAAPDDIMICKYFLITSPFEGNPPITSGFKFVDWWHWSYPKLINFWKNSL